MSQNETFKLINQWFDQLVDQAKDVQLIEIQQLKAAGDLSSEDIELLQQMLSADDRELAENVSELAPNWQQEDAKRQINDQPLIGAYRLLELIGSGGMGHVFLAERNDGSYEQQVAIKVAQFYLDPLLVKRFENERQILAQLTHPHIAQLLDGGTATNDQPFLVMEYIHGQSIDAYCIANDSGLRGRLNLVLQTCEAVSYAHQNLVLHRDLKPANILVNNSGQVKLLDFGIAKLLDADVDQQQKNTAQVLTRHYASPEQIKAQQMTTQSDLFSLAIITYELVSGYHPYDRESELERDQNVVSGKIKRITVRNNMSSAAFPELATIGSEKLTGDLENILNKALSPLLSNRYLSVEAFAQDIKNFLANRPIQARKPSIWYHIKKYIQRHKLLSALIMLTTVTLIVSSLFSYNRALYAEQQAEMARLEAGKSKAVAGFLIQLFSSSNPSRNQTEVIAQDILLQGFKDIEANVTLAAEVKFELLSVMYRSLWNLGKFKETAGLIDKHYEECVAALSELNGNCQALLIGQFDVYSNSSEYEKVLMLLNQAEQIELKQTDGNIKTLLYIYDTKLLTLMNLDQNKAAIAYGKKALALRQKYHRDDAHTLRVSLGNLALTYIQNQEFDAAMELIEQIPTFNEKIIDNSERHTSWANFYGVKAFYYARLHDSVKAAEYRQQAVDYMNQHFALLSEAAIWTNRVLATEMAKAGYVDGALAQYQVAEDLYQAQVSDNESHLFKIYAERLLLYLIKDDVTAAQQQRQLIENLAYDYAQYSMHNNMMAAADALYEIAVGEFEKANIQINKMVELYADIKSPDSHFPVYQLIAEGRYQIMLQQPELALQKFQQAAQFWQKYPNFNLHLKTVVEQHLAQLN